MAAQSMEYNDTLNLVEHTPPVHKRILDIIPGVSGGVARVMVGQPFDTIKTRMQVLGKGTLAARGLPESEVYNSSMDCVRKMFKNEGSLSLYKGTVAPLIGNMVLLGIHFPTFYKTRAYLEQNDEKGSLNPFKVWAAGGVAGAAGSFVSAPAELIRTKMQMVRKEMFLAKAAGKQLNTNEMYKGGWDCMTKILRHHGIKGFYQGWQSTLVRDIQGYGFFFLGYEATLYYLAGPNHNKADLHFSQVMLAGIMAGFGLWGSMFPIDTIKSKMQAQSLSNPEFSSTMDCVRKSLAAEGHAGLWRGVSAAMWRAIPVNAAIFLAVEGSRQLIDNTEDKVDAFVNNIMGSSQQPATV